MDSARISTSKGRIRPKAGVVALEIDYLAIDGASSAVDSGRWQKLLKSGLNLSFGRRVLVAYPILVKNKDLSAD